MIDISNLCFTIQTRGFMIIQNCNILLEIITKIESMIVDQKNQHPDLSDEEIIDHLKLKLRSENNH